MRYVPLFVTAAIIIVAYTNRNYIFYLIGRDPTLTGRISIWQILSQYIARRPLIGYGYGAFWRGDDALLQRLWNTVGWETPHAHNGYIDTVLDIGLIGLILVLVLYVSIIWNVVKKARKKIYPQLGFSRIWTIGVIIIITVYNTVESRMLRQNDIWWVLSIATFVAVSEGKKSNSQEYPNLFPPGNRTG